MEPVKTSQPPQSASPPQGEPYSLRREIDRALDWVRFVFQMLSRLGGPVQVLRTFWFIVTLLVRRTLVQWGWLKH